MERLRPPTAPLPEFSPSQAPTEAKLVKLLRNPLEYVSQKLPSRRRGRSGRGLSHRSGGRCSQCVGIGSEGSSFCQHSLFSPKPYTKLMAQILTINNTMV